jgi:hypothetical protein
MRLPRGAMLAARRPRAAFGYRARMATPSMRRPFHGLAVPAFAVALLTLAGCETTPKSDAPDPSVLGSWRAPADGSMVSFTATGLYTMVLKGQQRPVVGSYEFNPETGTLQLTTRRESPVCGDDLATYQVTVTDRTLDARVERDTCEIRSKTLASPLERAQPMQRR